MLRLIFSHAHTSLKCNVIIESVRRKKTLIKIFHSDKKAVNSIPVTFIYYFRIYLHIFFRMWTHSIFYGPKAL